MTADDRFGGTVSDWLHDRAGTGSPDYLDDILGRTARTRQRPGWTFTERWLPVDLTSRASPLAFPRLGRLILIGLLIVALAALAIIAVGSRTQRLPPPFGPARNGAIIASHDGDIFSIDPATARATLVVGGSGAFDFSPVFSRDGTKFVFLRSDGPLAEPAMLSLMVANADGSGVRAATPPVESLDWFDWSPSGTQIAYVSAGDAVGRGRRRIQAEEARRRTGSLPDMASARRGRDRLPARGVATRGLCHPAGWERSAPRAVDTPANNEYDYQSIAASPDGARITFTRWSTAWMPTAWMPSVFALDVETGEETAFAAPVGTGQRGPVVYSPDGTLVAYAQIFRDGAFQLVVADADGSGGQRAIGPRKAGPPDGSDVAATWAFTPDGTALIVRYGNDDTGTTQRLPIDGSPGSILDSGAFDFVDVQRLAP